MAATKSYSSLVGSATLRPLSNSTTLCEKPSLNGSVMRVASPEVRRAFEITGLDDYLLVALPGRS
jgi:hypothetical protein